MKNPCRRRRKKSNASPWPTTWPHKGMRSTWPADGGRAFEKTLPGTLRRPRYRSQNAQLDGLELLKRIKQGPLADMESHHDDRLRQHPRSSRGRKTRGISISSPNHSATKDVFPLLARIEREKKSPAAGTTMPASPVAITRKSSRPSSGSSSAMDRVKRMAEISAKNRRQRAVVRAKRAWQGSDCDRDPPQLAPPRISHLSKLAARFFPPQLIESELYGHEKGSFTGADQLRKGRFDLAEGGSLYLDRRRRHPHGSTSPKLLRAIEEKSLSSAWAGAATIKADVRIIASTKRNLLEKNRRRRLSAKTSTTDSTS